jgi:cysteine synthase
MRYESLLDAIGRTPLVRLQRITRHLKPAIYAKLEFMNPGGSVKDRIALRMIERAEREGKLKPGGTIVECTSGNTGMGLAMIAALRGYRTIFTTTDKQSREKINMLKAMGAEVIVCPTAVPPEDPRSYYSVARKLAQEIPNSFFMNQYDNPANPEAHYLTTGLKSGRTPKGASRIWSLGWARRHDFRGRALPQGAQPQYQGHRRRPRRLRLLRLLSSRQGRGSPSLSGGGDWRGYLPIHDGLLGGG